MKKPNKIIKINKIKIKKQTFKYQKTKKMSPNKSIYYKKKTKNSKKICTKNYQCISKTQITNLNIENNTFKLNNNN